MTATIEDLQSQLQQDKDSIESNKELTDEEREAQLTSVEENFRQSASLASMQAEECDEYEMLTLMLRQKTEAAEYLDSLFPDDLDSATLDSVPTCLDNAELIDFDSIPQLSLDSERPRISDDYICCVALCVMLQSCLHDADLFLLVDQDSSRSSAFMPSPAIGTR